jgi:hypothetical protein
MAKQEPGYVPQDGHSILIGQIGSAPEWYYFADDDKGRENAQNWLGVDGGRFRRLFRVYLDDVVEMATPPVPSKLVEKQKPETA